MLQCLLDKVDLSQAIARVKGDGADDNKACRWASALRAQASVPRRKNGKTRIDCRPRAEESNAILHLIRRFGRKVRRK